MIIKFIKPVLILALFALFFLLIGFVIYGMHGFFVGLFLFIVFLVCGYCFGDKWILYIYRAKLLQKKEAPEIFEIVGELSKEVHIKEPKIYLIPSASSNLFSLGKNTKNSSILITYGLIKLLNGEELKGVLAHEIVHIKLRDSILFLMVALQGMLFNLLANLFSKGFLSTEKKHSNNSILSIFAWIFALFSSWVVKFSISKDIELEADGKGARLAGNPLYLMSALGKMEGSIKKLPLWEAWPSMMHIFILNPIPDKKWGKFFNVHPVIEKRMILLEKMSSN